MGPESLRRRYRVMSSRGLDELKRVLARGDLRDVKRLTEEELDLLRQWLGGEEALQRYLAKVCER